jgi:excisionase family DNA binding protein
VSSPLVNHTIDETAKALRTSPPNVLRLIRRGELIAVKFGKRYIITDEDLRRFIEGHRTGAEG